MEALGWVSLIPVLVVMAVFTKKTAESLIVGTFVGAAILIISKGVTSVGAAMCIMVPISSWGVFYSSQLETIEKRPIQGFEVIQI